MALSWPVGFFRSVLARENFVRYNCAVGIAVFICAWLHVLNNCCLHKHVKLHFLGKPYLVCLLKTGKVNIYSLPDVKMLSEKLDLGLPE